MKSNPSKFLTLLISGLLLALTACSPATETTATAPQPAAGDYLSLVSATGKVIPEAEALLSVSTGGVIENILIEKGERVTAGQVLIQLEGSERQLAVVAAAELGRANAQFALDQLYQDTDLLAAEALRSAENAEKALEDLQHTEQQEALALQILATAEQTADEAARDLAILTKKPTQAAIEQTYSNLLLLENRLQKTHEDIADIEWQLKKYSSMPYLPKDIKTETMKGLRQALEGLEMKRAQEQLAYNKAERRYNDLLEPPDPIDLEVAQAADRAAQALLAQAQTDLDRVLAGPKAGEIALLEAQIRKGYQDYETYKTGPDPEDIALAEARVANAEAQLAAAQEILADLELTAPFDGIISEVYINASEWVPPGSPVLLIADLAHLQIETTDLSEIDVAKIKVNDTAVVTFDALPDLALEGTILQIAPKAAEDAGVNYPVLIELSEIPADLRWGMTAFVDIALNK